LGYHSAKRLASEGARILLTDINADQVDTRAEELTAQGYDVLACSHDVTDPGSWQQVKSIVLGRFSRIDILVNNAGIAEPAGILDASLENWNRHIDINLTGVFLGCQIGGRQMREQGDGGTIINISSIAGQRAFPSLAAYVASKGGVRMLTKAVALDLA
jgi:NAD(P)-dependent dehydrogenase (short-subunit alcohol dehydrogenase family)